MNNQKDLLHRDVDIKNISNVIQSAVSRKQRLSFAVDGRWGSGKTFFVNSLIEKIKSDFIVFEYDSWENDYYEDPLIGMLDSIKDELNRMNSTDKTLDVAAKKIIKNIVSVIGTFLDEVISSKTGFRPIIAIKKIKDFWNECSKEAKISDDFSPYNKLKAAKQIIIASMNKLSTIKPVIFVVDEIDRCLPNYTLKIIERIHHISENVENCITIFSVDTKQLQKIIELVYNKEEDTVKGYLRKVIDFTYNLGNGTLDSNFYDELEDYKKRFKDPIPGIKEDELKVFIHSLFNGLEMRTILKIITNAKYTHDLVFGDQAFSLELMCAELMLAWATKEYGDRMLTAMGKEIFTSAHNRKSFIKYLSEPRKDLQLTFYNHVMERKYINIYDLKSLMVYFVVLHDQYVVNLCGDIKFIPAYHQQLLNEYLASLIKIKC